VSPPSASCDRSVGVRPGHWHAAPNCAERCPWQRPPYVMWENGSSRPGAGRTRLLTRQSGDVLNSWGLAPGLSITISCACVTLASISGTREYVGLCSSKTRAPSWCYAVRTDLGHRRKLKAEVHAGRSEDPAVNRSGNKSAAAKQTGLVRPGAASQQGCRNFHLKRRVIW
jgi:hypothetical protein